MRIAVRIVQIRTYRYIIGTPCIPISKKKKKLISPSIHVNASIVCDQKRRLLIISASDISSMCLWGKIIYNSIRQKIRVWKINSTNSGKRKEYVFMALSMT